MTLITYVPAAPLSQFVAMFWCWEGYHPPHAKERILPNGMMEITLNLLDAPFLLYQPRDNAPSAPPSQQVHGLMAAGARSDYFVIDTARPASILAVWFKPGSARAFFGVSAAELHNCHLPMDVLWGAQAHTLTSQLLEAPTLEARFRLLESALLARLKAAPVRHPALAYALNLLHQQPQTATINAVLAQIALSPPRFIQLFREDIGMTPKRYSRVRRFQRALRNIAQATTADIDWADVALRCGYYDQAHFINDFQAFSGITPTQYAPQSREHNSHLPYFDNG